MDPANDNSNAGENLSGDDIALLCDIGTYAPEENALEKRARVARLIAEGYVTCSHADMAAVGAKFALSRKGERVLEERGAGLNEA